MRNAQLAPWRDFGPPDAPAVLLLHSIATNADLWAPQIPVWSTRFRLLAVDLPGHGASAPRAGVHSLDAYADAVAQVLIEASVESVSIVGLSLGGMIAQAFALRFPERTRALALCNTSGRTPPALLPVWSQRLREAQESGMKSQVEPTLARWFTRGFIERAPLNVARIATMIAGTSVAGYAAAIEAIQGLDTLGRLSSVDVPALVVTGQQDPVATPEVATTLSQHLRHSQLVVLPDAAHLSNVEQPVAFAEIVGAFLERTAR
jgi:3-oxoadipate enol-lactonase